MTHLGIEVQGEKSPSTLQSEGQLRTEMRFAKGQVYTCCISFLMITFTVHKENFLEKFIPDVKMNEWIFQSTFYLQILITGLSIRPETLRQWLSLASLCMWRCRFPNMSTRTWSCCWRTAGRHQLKTHMTPKDGSCLLKGESLWNQQSILYIFSCASIISSFILYPIQMSFQWW